MLTVRENFLQTIHRDGKPDRLVNGYEFMGLIVPDPLLKASNHGLRRGEQGKDAYGVVWTWSEDQPAAAPLPHADVLVIKDVTAWEDTLVFPNLEALDWSGAKEHAAALAGTDKFSAAFFPSGLFERLHFLMGFENALVNLMIEPDATKALIEAIGKHRMRYAELLIENLNPEMFFLHDDWGMKHSLFVSPEVWREMIKPHYEELYGYLRSKDLLIVHHADSFMEPIIGDMADMGIAVWQGVLPENDIIRLQKELDGRMTLMGGIDAAIIDSPSATEDQTRAETRRACETYGPGGHFIPCFTYGGPRDLIFPEGEQYIEDEINRYNQRVYGAAL
ncbi:MAG: uroporphyrinogen decarboxylase (URO-D) [Clostridiales Family XIII bacterium]|jgi:hypothetical protein|nr:uroporphyrinogen decarboxylase (URO-D) [Clostridiales Family XIII bacterium]